MISLLVSLQDSITVSGYRGSLLDGQPSHCVGVCFTTHKKHINSFPVNAKKQLPGKKKDIDVYLLYVDCCFFHNPNSGQLRSV